MSKLTQAIRKISGYDELKRLIEQLLKQKPDIPSQRGIAYAVYGALEAAKTGKNGGPGQGNVNPPQDEPGGDDSTDDANDDQNGGGGSYCAEDLIDSNTPAADNTEVQLNQIGCIVDVAIQVAGEPQALTINTDGLFRLPDDWTPDQPGPATDVVTGWRWIGTSTSLNGDSAIYTHYEDALESMRYSAGAQGLMGDFYEWDSSTPESIAALYGPGSNAQPSVAFNVTRLFGVVPDDNFQLAITGFRCDRAAGLAGIPGATESCSIEDTDSTRFPMEFNGQLVMDVDRKLRSSPYDPTKAGQIYREGVSSLAFKFGAAEDRTGYWEIGKNDTFLLYELDTAQSPPQPTGDVSIYDARTRQLKQRLPASLVNTYPDIVEKYRLNPGSIRRSGGHVI